MPEYLLKIRVTDTYSKAAQRIRQLGKPVLMWRETVKDLDSVAMAKADPDVTEIFGPYEPGTAPSRIDQALEEKRIK